MKELTSARKSKSITYGTLFSYNTFTLRAFFSLWVSGVLTWEDASFDLKNDGSVYLFRHAPAPAISNLWNEKKNH